METAMIEAPEFERTRLCPIPWHEHAVSVPDRHGDWGQAIVTTEIGVRQS